MVKLWCSECLFTVLDLLSFAIEDEITTATRDFSSWSSSCDSSNMIRCHTYIMNDGLCLRANTIPMYMEANRLVMPGHNIICLLLDIFIKLFCCRCPSN